MPASAAARAVPLETVFDQMQEILARHAKLFTELTGQVKNKRDYHLIIGRPMVIDGREKDGLYFASLIQQKDAVGFYFMPIYCCAEVKARLSPELLRYLDGKSCFHLRVLTPQLKKDVAAALKVGLEAYRARHWL